MIPLGVLASARVAAGDLLTLTSVSTTTANLAIGTAAASRVVVLFMLATTGVNADAATALSIGGVSATRDYLLGAGWDNLGKVEVWRASVPTGTTASISHNGTSSSFTYALFTAQVPLTFVGGAATRLAIGESTKGLNVPALAGATVLGGYMARQLSTSASWSGLTEKWEVAVDPSSGGGTGLAAGSSHLVTVTLASPAANASTPVGAVAYRAT